MSRMIIGVMCMLSGLVDIPGLSLSNDSLTLSSTPTWSPDDPAKTIHPIMTLLDYGLLLILLLILTILIYFSTIPLLTINPIHLMILIFLIIILPQDGRELLL